MCKNEFHSCCKRVARGALTDLVLFCYALDPVKVSRLNLRRLSVDCTLCARGASGEKAVNLALLDMAEARFSARKLQAAEGRARKVLAILESAGAPKRLCKFG